MLVIPDELCEAENHASLAGSEDEVGRDPLVTDEVVLFVADPPGVGAPLGLGSGLACRCQIF